MAGRKVAVERLGKVEMALCSILKQAGANLIVYDTAAERTTLARDQFGAAISAPGQIHASDVDVYSPCALRAVLSPETIPVIKASVIAGAANNQFSNSQQHGRLQERGITYCPDYVVNAC